MKDKLYEVEDQILELDDGSKYVIVDTVSYENIKYYFAFGYLEDGYNIEDYQFFRIDGDFVEAVYDEKLTQTLVACVIADNINDNPVLSEKLELAVKAFYESKKDRE